MSKYWRHPLDTDEKETARLVRFIRELADVIEKRGVELGSSHVEGGPDDDWVTHINLSLQFKQRAAE